MMVAQRRIGLNESQQANAKVQINHNWMIDMENFAHIHCNMVQ